MVDLLDGVMSGKNMVKGRNGKYRCVVFGVYHGLLGPGSGQRAGLDLFLCTMCYCCCTMYYSFLFLYI